MSHTDFEEQARSLLRREPFRPFALRLKNGEMLVIRRPLRLAFDGGAAVGSSQRGKPVFFAYDDVEEFLSTLPETVK